MFCFLAYLDIDLDNTANNKSLGPRRVKVAAFLWNCRVLDPTVPAEKKSDQETLSQNTNENLIILAQGFSFLVT